MRIFGHIDDVAKASLAVCEILRLRFRFVKT